LPIVTYQGYIKLRAIKFMQSFIHTTWVSEATKRCTLHSFVDDV
jgi:hypothetical protein